MFIHGCHLTLSFLCYVALVATKSPTMDIKVIMSIFTLYNLCLIRQAFSAKIKPFICIVTLQGDKCSQKCVVYFYLSAPTTGTDIDLLHFA